MPFYIAQIIAVNNNDPSIMILEHTVQLIEAESEEKATGIAYYTAFKLFPTIEHYSQHHVTVGNIKEYIRSNGPTYTWYMASTIAIKTEGSLYSIERFIGLADAISLEEALSKLHEKALEMLPEFEGYYNHHVLAEKIPEDIVDLIQETL